MIMIRKREADEDGPTHFLPGELVRHRRYGYRGVVVEVDERCLASEGWYKSNQSQPDRDQPWYHVLVDGSAHSTYAAQQNLEADPSQAPISHPLLKVFFESFLAGTYQRNERPWETPG